MCYRAPFMWYFEESDGIPGGQLWPRRGAVGTAPPLSRPIAKSRPPWSDHCQEWNLRQWQKNARRSSDSGHSGLKLPKSGVLTGNYTRLNLCCALSNQDTHTKASLEELICSYVWVLQLRNLSHWSVCLGTWIGTFISEPLRPPVTDTNQSRWDPDLWNFSNIAVWGSIVPS